MEHLTDNELALLINDAPTSLPHHVRTCDACRTRLADLRNADQRWLEISAVVPFLREAILDAVAAQLASDSHSSPEDPTAPVSISDSESTIDLAAEERQPRESRFRGPLRSRSNFAVLAGFVLLALILTPQATNHLFSNAANSKASTTTMTAPKATTLTEVRSQTTETISQTTNSVSNATTTIATSNVSGTTTTAPKGGTQTVILRPSGDVIVSNVLAISPSNTAGSNTNVYSVVNEDQAATDDSTYVRGMANHDDNSHEVSYSANLSGTITKVVIHTRVWQATAQGAFEVQLWDCAGGSNKKLLEDFGPQTAPGSWTNYDFASEQSKVAFSPISATSLCTNMIFHRTAGTGALRYSIIWLEVTTS